MGIADIPRDLERSALETLPNRVSALEQEVTRLSAFVDTQQQPLFLAHGVAHPPAQPGEPHHDDEPHDHEDDGHHGGRHGTGSRPDHS